MNGPRRAPILSDCAPIPDGWSDHAQLSAALLTMKRTRSWRGSRRPSGRGRRTDLGRSLAYAAALRVARLGVANERADWETALHVFTYANAGRQARADRDGRQRGGRRDRGGARGLHGVYSHALNVPPARLPGEGDDRPDDLPDTIKEIRAGLLSAFDRQTGRQ